MPNRLSSCFSSASIVARRSKLTGGAAAGAAGAVEADVAVEALPVTRPSSVEGRGAAARAGLDATVTDGRGPLLTLAPNRCFTARSAASDLRLRSSLVPSDTLWLRAGCAAALGFKPMRCAKFCSISARVFSSPMELVRRSAGGPPSVGAVTVGVGLGLSPKRRMSCSSKLSAVFLRSVRLCSAACC
jgi:hypothetical protein